MKKLWLVLGLCAAGSLARAAEPTANELVTQLQAAMQKAMAAQNAQNPQGNAQRGGENGEGRRVEYQMYMTQVAMAVRQAYARGDGNQVDEILAGLQTLTTDPEVQKLATALAEKVKADLKAKQEAAASETDAQVDEAVKAALAAKDPKELDGWIMKLSKGGRRGYANSEENQQAQEKARNAVTFLCRWQDYLLLMNMGLNERAQGSLRQMSQDHSSDGFLPRSEILSRMTPGSGEDSSKPEAVQVPSLKGVTLADVPKFKQTVRALQAKNPNNGPLQQMIQRLTSLDQAQEKADEGLLGQTFGYCTGQNGNDDEGLLGLKQELLLTILPRYIDAVKDYPAQAKENPAGYLQRVAKEARAKGDWLTYWKALDTYRAVAFGQGSGPAWLQAEVMAASLFVQAQNLEKVAQYVEAVRTYKRIASSTGENLPLQEAAARLEAIKKEHSEDYEAAMKPLPPPVIQSPMQGRMMPGNVPQSQ